MNLVIGRGSARKVYEIPSADIIKRADQKEVQNLINNVCELLGVPVHYGSR